MIMFQYKKLKFTSGKWFMRISKPLLPGTKKQVHVLTDFGSSTQTICQLSIRKGETKANAKLIAAAPELLKALQRFIKFADNQKLEYESSMIREAKEAIKKAIE